MSPENLAYNAAYEAAQVLARHFGLRPWSAMANNRGDLRRAVRNHNYDPNEPTREDCIDAAREALTVHTQYIATHAAKEPNQ